MKKVGTQICLAALLVACLSVLSQAGNKHKRIMIGVSPGQSNKVVSMIKKQGGHVHHQFDSISVVAASVPETALFGLEHNPNIEFLEDDPMRYPNEQNVPYGIDQVQARQVWDANLDNSIDGAAPTGEGVLVCIIDSGLWLGHEEFADVTITGGYPDNPSQADYFGRDGCGHGTHVAGTIAAAHNDLGVVGVSPGAVSLFVVKVFGTDNMADGCGWSYASDLIDAAERCGAAGSKIISMSLGGTLKSRAEDKAFERLYNQGVLSIAAAGNDGNTRKSYPASYSSVMSVAAVDQNNLVADFSQQNSEVEIAAPGVGVLSTVPWQAQDTISVEGTSYQGAHIEYAAFGAANGALKDGGFCLSGGNWTGKIVLCQRGEVSLEKVANVEASGGVAAIIYNNEPGGFIGTLGEGNSSLIPAISLSLEDGSDLVDNRLGQVADLVTEVYFEQSGYEAWDGTSMATPHVSGVAALVWSAHPTLSNAEIRTALIDSASDLPPLGRDDATGYGLVQAKDALVYLDTGPTPESDCNNGLDDDNDGLIDCDDGDCTADPACEPSDQCNYDGFCAGSAAGEDCFTCSDCACKGTNCSKACCGNGIQEKGENANSCPIDLP